MKSEFLKRLDATLGRLLVSLYRPPKVYGLIPPIPRQVLIVRPGGIGDAFLLAPAIKTIKTYFPSVELDVLAEKRNAGAFSLMPGIRRVFLYDAPGGLLSVAGCRYDVIIDTEQWYRLSAVVTRLVRSRMKVGFASNERYRMYTHPVPYSQNFREAESFQQLLGPLGIAGAQAPTGEILCISSDARAKAAHLLKAALNRAVVALFPSASIAEKRWDLDKFRKLVAWCVSHGLQVVVLGGRQDRVLAEKIAAGQLALNLAGLTSLDVSAAVLEKSAVVVSGDSGVLHLASLLGRPTVSLFGPSSSAKWAPSGPYHIVLDQELPCSPCSRFGTIPPCPIGVQCIQGITVDAVKDAVQTLLQRTGKI